MTEPILKKLKDAKTGLRVGEIATATNTPVNVVIRTLCAYVRSGKVRNIGSGTPNMETYFIV